MVEKLKSILRRTHWSLLVRAAIFAVSWYLLPLWLFTLIALYLYFVPIFRSGRLAAPFLILVILTYIEAPNPIFMVVFGLIFYVLLLIKGLFLIDRRSAFEILVLMLSFLLLRDFYMALPQGIVGPSLWYAFLAAILITLLARSFVKYLSEEEATSAVLGPVPTASAPIETPEMRMHRAGEKERMALWLTFLLIWQTLIVGLFLPVDFIYQTVAVFLVAVIIIDLMPEYLFGGLTRAKILTTVTIVLVLFALVLTAAHWQT